MLLTFLTCSISLSTNNISLARCGNMEVGSNIIVIVLHSAGEKVNNKSVPFAFSVSMIKPLPTILHLILIFLSEQFFKLISFLPSRTQHISLYVVFMGNGFWICLPPVTVRQVSFFVSASSIIKVLKQNGLM